VVNTQHPLQKAAKHQLWDVCCHLFTTHRYTPGTEELLGVLKCSAENGATAVVATLLQWGCKERHKDCDVCAVLQVALELVAGNGHAAVCDLLAQHPCITAQSVRLAVCKAAAGGHLDVLQMLITSRPDAVSPGLYGNPMYEAAANSQIDSMQLLLQHGADINCTSGMPWSEACQTVPPVQAAVIQGQAPATIQWMLEQGADAGPALKAAAVTDNLPVLRLLLDSGPDINTRGGPAI
jgi:hypothetical protein